MVRSLHLMLAPMLLSVALLATSAASANDAPSVAPAESARATDEQLRAQAQALFVALPTDVTVDEQQAALGRALFFDTRIGASSRVLHQSVRE